MSPASRTILFCISAAVFLALLCWGFLGLPPVGQYRGPYGDVVNAITVPERHITDAVTAVNFDIRGFDTLGEEFILFTSVAGVLLLLRKPRDEASGLRPDRLRSRFVDSPSDAVRMLSISLVGPIIVFGFYVVTHGQLTPGGGFQGGVILAAAPLLMYLAGHFNTLEELAPEGIIDPSEAVGAGGYALIGFAGILAGGAYLENTLPLGKVGSIASSGTVALIDIAVGLEVGCGLLLLWLAFLAKALSREQPKTKPTTGA